MKKIATTLLLTFVCFGVNAQNHIGEYTQSGIGRNLVTGEYLPDIGSLLMNVEFYDSYILINSQKYFYQRSDNGWKIYSAKLNDYTVWSYYVDSQYNMFCRIQMAFMGIIQITQYTVTKGHVRGSSSGYNPYATPSAPSTSGSNASAPVIVKRCHLCAGTGICTTCNGRGLMINSYTGKYQDCPNCHAPKEGKCHSCGGSGRR